MNARTNKRFKIRRRKRAALQKLSKGLSKDTPIYYSVKVLGIHNKGKTIVCKFYLKWISCEAAIESSKVNFSEKQLNPQSLPVLQSL